MEWKELKTKQVLEYGIKYPLHRLLCYLSAKTNKNLISNPLSVTLNITERCNLQCKMCEV